MKNLSIPIVALLLATSCSEEINFANVEHSSTPIILNGDYVSTSVAPLTRASGQCYYGFEIDSMCVTVYDEGKFGTWIDTTYVHYAEGLFESSKNISITLEKNRKYRIRCQIVEEREDKLFREGNVIYEPFVGRGYGKGTAAEINNMFIYGGTQQIWAYKAAPFMCTVSKETNSAAQVDYYYGEVTTEKITDNSPIRLEMERRNYGLHIIITPPQEGTLTVESTNAPRFKYTLTDQSASVNEEYIYALEQNNDFRTFWVQVKWQRADGTIVDLSPASTKLWNKTMTTIKVDVNGRVGSSDIEFTYDSAMSDEMIEIK